MAELLEPLRLEIDPLTASPLPISLSLVKDHCAIDTDDFDALLDTYIRAAIDWAETTTRRTIYSRSHVWVLRDFPLTGRQDIHLPRGKTQSVESVQYTDGDLVTQTLEGPSSGSPDGSDYREDLRGDDGGVLVPNDGETWPDADTFAPDPVTINFTAGWLESEVPDNVTTAILFAVNDMYEMRGAVDVARAGARLDTREALIAPYRLMRFYA